MFNSPIPEFTLSLDMKGVKASERIQVKTSAELADVARKCFGDANIEWREEMLLIGLNAGHKVLGFFKVSAGGITGTICDPRIVMQFALLSNATCLALVHNHPSGEVFPSGNDRALTEKIKQGLGLFDITLVDHIIITPEMHFSFADNGLI